MAKGIDDLIDWLVAETAYAGEKGLSVAEFVTAVGRFNARPQKRKNKQGSDESNEAKGSGPETGGEDLQLARKAWEWLVERPEIIVGHGGQGRKLSLDDALSLPEPAVSNLAAAETTEAVARSSRRARGVSRTPTPAPIEEDRGTRPRLYATEKTVWYTLTGHDVDYKKIPPLEWKCLMGIASVKERGILQADLRNLVNQDKRSVPKRTDFLTTKGYAVKRTTIARGYRTSMLWLTEFAPVQLELPAEEAGEPRKAGEGQEDLTSAGGDIDLSAAYLTKDLDPVPWRNRWLGETIEFASFGRTIIAVIKAWGVIRIVDLKQKLGIHGRRWQMRTLAKSCRELAAAGVLRYVAAVRQDERRLFKDCIKFEREPSKDEWHIFLAAGRKRMPLTELRARRKKQRLHEASGVGEDFAGLDDDDDLDELDEDEDGEGREGGMALTLSWVPEKPLANTIFDTIRHSGARGLTSPDICKATVGAQFARYMFSLVTDMAKPGNQPEYLARFQLSSAPARTGKNNAYVFTANGVEAREDSADGEPSDLTRQFGFPARPESSSRTLTELSRSVSGRMGQRRPYGNRRLLNPEPVEDTGRRKRGRPKKQSQLAGEVENREEKVEKEEQQEVPPEEEPEQQEEPKLPEEPEGTDEQPPVPKVPMPEAPEPEAPEPIPDDNDESRPAVVRGEPGSLRKRKTAGRPKRSIVLIVRLKQLKDPEFLASGKGYKKNETKRLVVELGDVYGEASQSEQTGPEREPQVVVLSRYNGSPGRLTVDSDKKELVFSFVGGSGKGTAKAPITISVEDISGTPSIRDAPGGDGQALVLQAQEKGNELKMVWPFVFILDEDDRNLQDATTLCQALLALDNPTEENKAEEADEDKGEAEEEEAEPAPVRKRGRQAKKRGKAAFSAEGFVCKTCGGRWKNPLGLQYHQTKARTTCNPNYMPPPPAPLLRKEIMAEKVRSSADGASEENNRSPSVSRRMIEPSSPSSMSLFGISRRLFGGGRGVSSGPRGLLHNSSRATSPAEDASRKRVHSPEPMDVAAAAEEAKRRRLLMTNGTSSLETAVNIDPRLRTPPVPQASMLPPTSVVLPLAAMRTGTPMRTPSRTPTLDGRPAILGSGVLLTKQSGFRMPEVPQTATAAAAAASTSTSTPAPASKVTYFMVRSSRTLEIVRHLLSASGGVFPSDRSLWYAAFTVYTKTFPGEDPPTLNVSRATMKKLEMSGEAEEHTFGFRDAKGRFIYLRLLVQCDGDKTKNKDDRVQSEEVQEMKRRMQESYPQPYVPSEFAPSEKDLAVLRVYDRERRMGGQKQGQLGHLPAGNLGAQVPRQQGRRALASEIEVLDAPFYEHVTQRTYRVGRTGPLMVNYAGYEEAEAYESDDEDGGHGSGKRKAGGQASAHVVKRRKTRFADYITGKVDDDSGDEEGEGAVDGERGDENLEEEEEEDCVVMGVTGKIRLNNPGLDSLPRSFFQTGQELQGSAEAAATAEMTLCFLPPNTLLREEGEEVEEEMEEEEEEEDEEEEEEEVVEDDEETAAAQKPDGAFSVAKLAVIKERSTGHTWPFLQQGFFLQHDHSGFTMDGWIPSQADLLRDNLPQSVNDCMAMLRANTRAGSFNLSGSDDDLTAAEQFFVNVDRCQYWELSQRGTQLMTGCGSVVPEYVFLHMGFMGEHETVEEEEDEEEDMLLLRWNKRNQFMLDSIPYAALAQAEEGRERTSVSAGRPGQIRQAMYLASSRREMTAYPQAEEEYIRGGDESAVVAATVTGDKADVEAVDWTAEDTRIAAFVAVRTLLGGVHQAVDWGLMLRLFPDRKLSGLRVFWRRLRKERLPYVDTLGERFQDAFLDAYSRGELPPLNYDDVLAYDWRGLVAWTLRLMRRGPAALPATRAKLEADFEALPPWGETGGGGCMGLGGEAGVSAQMVWREEYFHPARSVWNRLQDSAGEAAAVMVDGREVAPTTPSEAAAAAAAAAVSGDTRAMTTAQETLRHLVARSWLRALCATPHDRYRPSRVKQKLLTLATAAKTSTTTTATTTTTTSETDSVTINRQLQTAIVELQNERVLRRTKSMVAVGGRMYLLAEAYGTALAKHAHADKLRQAAACKARLDAAFAAGEQPEVSATTNDDGAALALLNLQAHGRVRIEAVDAPCVPFGFEPGNYETRKFPKHYQRFRQRVVATERYMGEAELQTELQTELQGLLTAPPAGSQREIPIWCDFFGVLDTPRFVRLASAVVFSLATRGGATTARQTAAHLRPLLEPFEVEMLMDWGAGVGILKRPAAEAAPSEAVWTVSEWWWLLLGRMYESEGVD